MRLRQRNCRWLSLAFTSIQVERRRSHGLEAADSSFDTSGISAAATAGGTPFAAAGASAAAAPAGGSGTSASESASGLVRYASVEEEVRASLRLPALFVPAPPLLSAETFAALCVRADFRLVRPAEPLRPERAIVVEDGPLFTAQGGGDAFALAHRFLAKLEQVQQSF